MVHQTEAVEGEKSPAETEEESRIVEDDKDDDDDSFDESGVSFRFARASVRQTILGDLKMHGDGSRRQTVYFPEEESDLVEVHEYEEDTPATATATTSSGKQISPMNPKYTYREHAFIVIIAMVLSFNSGMSNGISLSGFLTPIHAKIDKQSTSGYTGLYTASALALAELSAGNVDEVYPGVGNLFYFGFQIGMISCFIGGACISALMNPRPQPWRLAPMYAPTFFVGALFMLAAAISSSVEGSQDKVSADLFFFFVALANGVQNGVSSMYSANLIRTTHMTGTSTDIGLFLGQLLRGNHKNTWKLKILICLAISFWLGGYVAYFAVRRFLAFTLLFNAAIFLLVSVLMVAFLAMNLHLSMYQAFIGTWYWQRALHQLSYRSHTCGTAKPEERLQEVFESMDKDGDGFITSDELYNGLCQAGMSCMSRRQVHAMFAVCDRDNDGKITLQDWYDLVQGENVLVG